MITSPASSVVRKVLHWVLMNDLKRVFLNEVVVSLGLDQAEDHLVFRVTTSADSRNNVIIVKPVDQLAFLADPFIRIQVLLSMVVGYLINRIIFYLLL